MWLVSQRIKESLGNADAMSRVNGQEDLESGLVLSLITSDSDVLNYKETEEVFTSHLPLES